MKLPAQALHQNKCLPGSGVIPQEIHVCSCGCEALNSKAWLGGYWLFQAPGRTQEALTPHRSSCVPTNRHCPWMLINQGFHVHWETNGPRGFQEHRTFCVKTGESQENEDGHPIVGQAQVFWILCTQGCVTLWPLSLGDSPWIYELV